MKILENQIMIRAGMKRHKGSFIGIGILLFLTALSLTTVLMIALVGNSYIREEMERAGFGDLTAWASDVPDMEFLLESIREQEGVEGAEVQELVFSEYEANGMESDSEGQMIPWNLEEKLPLGTGIVSFRMIFPVMQKLRKKSGKMKCTSPLP